MRPPHLQPLQPMRPLQVENRIYSLDSPATSSTNLLPAPTTPTTPTSPKPREDVRAAFLGRPSSVRSTRSMSSLNSDSPYLGVGASTGKHGNSLLSDEMSDKFSLAPDPTSWSHYSTMNHTEPDDYLHNPDPRRDRKSDQGGTMCTARGISNLGCLAILCTGLLTLFAGYPLLSFFTRHPLKSFGGFNVGGTNETGQVPAMPGNWGVIDLDTPKEAYTKPSYVDGSTLQLVFSDEFNVDGRSFYPGDDPYWEAVDLHYWQTGNMEWYDPAAITTSNGSLRVTMSTKAQHGMNYTGGMMSTWNKFCFTGGLIETSVVLPGLNNIMGLWPAVWTMGNLGRAGYGASLDGMWPYTYDSCDVGTVANQSINGVPPAASDNGKGQPLSYLPGQRLSRCTCPGESHPGPIHSDGTYVGRSAPEIDIFEAQIKPFNGGVTEGEVSQSCQWAPFNQDYTWFYNQSNNMVIPNPDVTVLNSYFGSIYQQATSGVTVTNQSCYEGNGGGYAVYGFEYKPGFDGAYISWIANDAVAWTLNAAGMAADTAVEISARPVPQEPMYIIVNLGMSTSFGRVDTAHIPFPATMSIDYIRVYQRSDSINIGCDPPDFPTEAYINQYIGAYTNPNLTTWVDDYGQPVPKNSYLNQC
ncbi:glycoside hydrolase family 16 protein [Jaapia argillacea MUCL 33604]|uniref:Glycoside hydrolase family 16 protein n=1 Tax=Jaapia argillacea MUCL 33604 TaxID=933084 RepID=A0A067PMD0_9AGAM|nr:glycoside hydrolase family 16 protein [Jaapia argillacea MUCL 33604]